MNTRRLNGSTTTGRRQGRNPFEILLCEELSDMVNCSGEKKGNHGSQNISAGTTKLISRQSTKPFSALVSSSKENSNPTIAITEIDLKTLQRRIVKRQIFTAIAVAIIMALPQVAPHIFTFKLRSVLSIKFWRSFMEFLTVALQ